VYVPAAGAAEPHRALVTSPSPPVPGAKMLKPHLSPLLEAAAAQATVSLTSLEQRDEAHVVRDRVAAELVFPLAKCIGTGANVSHYWPHLLDLSERRAAGLPDELAGLCRASACKGRGRAREWVEARRGRVATTASGWRF